MNSIDKDCFLRKVDCEIYYCMVSKLACEQALLFGRAKLASRERASEGPRKGFFAARSRVLARLASLAQIGELARRLPRNI